ISEAMVKAMMAAALARKETVLRMEISSKIKDRDAIGVQSDNLRPTPYRKKQKIRESNSCKN
ncbi:MAG: hypothetical protein KA294_05390, partial [Giesbergeria sp.]|nr:hypothetical protein [Giesbergeria sp.]